MHYKGTDYRSVWADFKNKTIYIINQTKLPFEFVIKELKTIEGVIESIKKLEVRGAPAIGITAAYAIWLSFSVNKGIFAKIENDYNKLISSRPTAVNLKRAADFVFDKIKSQSLTENQVFELSQKFTNNEINACYKIGLNGVGIIEQIYKTKKSTVNILTHCNAGWLACGDFGTALSPIYEANKRNIPIHVWVDETRPLNQGSRLTAWELNAEKIPFSIISDNSGGLLMMNKQVDMTIVGADRIVKNGDTANKIGTYLKALAAKDNNIPFYVAAPMTTFDFSTQKGSDIKIEERKGNEMQLIRGKLDNEIIEIKQFPDEFNSINHAFDITPAKLITKYITENGIFKQLYN